MTSLKTSIRDLLFSPLYYSRSFAFVRYLANRIENRAVILCYHRVIQGQPDNYSIPGTQVDIRAFWHQLRLLSKMFRIIPLPELLMRLRNDRPLDKNLMVLTFDDGFKDGFTHVLPILKKLSIPATFFVSPLFLMECSLPWHDILLQYLSSARREISVTIQGQTFLIRPGRDLYETKTNITKVLSSLPHEKRMSVLGEFRETLRLESIDLSNTNSMLSREDIIRMRESGLIEFGAHSMTHPMMSECSKTQIMAEVRESKRMLELILDEPVRSFAYPFGIYTPEVVETVHSGGFEAAVTTHDGLVGKNDNLLLLNRINVVRDDSMISLLTKKILLYYLRQAILR